MSNSRSSGILLHITSLPGPHGLGDLGPAAYRFADFLHKTHQTYWQVLPLNPIGPGASPYSSPSTFAGNALLVSPDLLVEEGLLTKHDLTEPPDLKQGLVDYGRAIPYKSRLLEIAFERFQNKGARDLSADFEAFKKRESHWLEDYAVFRALSEVFDTPDWTSWPEALQKRNPPDVEEALQSHRWLIRKHTFWQFLFDRQWNTLRSYCHKKGIRLFGDLPIYVAHDSADVWANQQLFKLDDRGQPTSVAGVPPDYFSETGQRWGNPVYRWDVMARNDYDWWTSRLSSVLSRVDMLRLDHFRGFEAYWEIPASEDTAVNGEWRKGPDAHFFDALQRELGDIPLVAEDLGIITPEVHELMREFDIPGMAVLCFGLSSDPSSDYLPHHFRRDLVAYTSTHDTNTLKGWLEEAEQGISKEDAEDVSFALNYLNTSEDKFHLAGVQALLSSVANKVIFPMQDLIGLGSDARMNIPGDSSGNWRWRLQEGQLPPAVAETLKKWTEIYDRKA